MMHRKKPQEQSELILSDNTTELLIFKKMAEDMEFAHMVLASAEAELFSAKPLGKMFNIFKSYYSKNPVEPLKIGVIMKTKHNEDGQFEPFYKDMEKLNLKDYPREVIIANADRYIREQKFSKAVMHAVEVRTNAEKNTPENVALMMSLFDNAYTSSMFYNMGLDYINSVENRYMREKEKYKFVIPTGIKIWDAQFMQTSNGIPPGTLTVVAGQSNIGKSIVLGSMSVNACNLGKKVALITLEMDEDTYASRIDANLSQINVNELLKHQISVKDALKAWKKDHPESNIMIKQFPTSTLTPSSLKAYLIQLRSRFKFDVVVIDYINLMISDRANSSDNSYTKIKQIAEDLRGLAIFFNVPFFSATQFNRSGYGTDQKPSAQAIGECIALLATTDVMIGIYQYEQDKVANILRSIFMKNRIGDKDKEFIHPLDKLHMKLKDGTISQVNTSEENIMSKFFGISQLGKDNHAENNEHNPHQP